MFERFTEKAIKTIMLAQKEARDYKHNFVSPEIMFLGMAGVDDKIVSVALQSNGVDIEKARAKFERVIGKGNDQVVVEIPFTAPCKRLLEYSWDEARQLGHNHIGVEHLFLALIQEAEESLLKSEEPPALYKMFDALGVDGTALRADIIKRTTSRSSTDF